MASCCSRKGYDRTFNDRFARHTANRYRKRGLDKAARQIVDAVAERDLAGATILEIGGGVGGIQLELLKLGAKSATNLELSAAYESQARRLLVDNGMADRVQRRIVDIASEPDDVDLADVVVMHRVVCCYPDYAALLSAAATHARHLVVFSHPPRNLWSRAIIGLGNCWLLLRGSEFRVFAHPPAAMRETLATHGLRAASPTSAGGWRVTAAQRWLAPGSR